MQMVTGKTNNGLKLFARVARHANPNSCAIDSLGFFFMYRFHMSGEMNVPPDLFDNQSWFDIEQFNKADHRRKE
jgi:hypothetical protein